MACVDAVGGDSQRYVDWMALPELMHVGSLIVDDVQDQSTIRRGGPSVHMIHGEAIAINSGNAAYFIGQTCIYHGEGTDEKKNRVYGCYFEGMRASHSGQALDINGLDYMIPLALKDDAVAKLLPKRVVSIHRLKSGAPSGYLAKIGSILGDASKEQEEALTNFFYTLGISFQIIDDTLNLKGFKDNLKTKAEDITAGKITYPVALAMSKMPSKERVKLWNIVKSKTDDIKMLTKAVDLINKYNAIEESEKIARNELEKAWKKLDPIIEDSVVKINLRAFSWYVLERTY
jgi:geranylgeranyl pyrophosphate synthase